MKRLFICCDGTWDSPSALCDGVPVPSNVVKFYNCVVRGDVGDVNALVRQLAYYHCGVGADEPLLKKILYGATGKGLGRNIQSAYFWLAEHYTPGDEIFIVGFSRGAFTARSLVGMLHHCGLLTPVNATWPLVEEAFRCYRLPPPSGRKRTPFARNTAIPTTCGSSSWACGTRWARWESRRSSIGSTSSPAAFASTTRRSRRWWITPARPWRSTRCT